MTIYFSFLSIKKTKKKKEEDKNDSTERETNRNRKQSTRPLNLNKEICKIMKIINENILRKNFND